MSDPPSPPPVSEHIGQSAVVLPSFGVYDSSDILTPSDINHNESPSPYGIILIAYNEQDDEEILPLYYVSAKAAHQRSPESHPLNGDGVIQGWYTVAQPGMHYSVRYVSNNNPIKHKPLIKSQTDNCFEIILDIDGRRVDSHVLLFSDTCDLDEENGWDGFSRGITRNESGYIRSISQFRFAKLGASLSENSQQTPTETIAPDNLGTVRFSFKIGQKTEDLNPGPTAHDSYQQLTDSVEEKSIAKKGISLKTEAGRSNQIDFGGYCDFINSKSLPELTININVREKTWLQSRKILDDAGNACSCDDFVRSRSAQASQLAPSIAVDLTVVEFIDLEKEEFKPIIKDEVDLTLD